MIGPDRDTSESPRAIARKKLRSRDESSRPSLITVYKEPERSRSLEVRVPATYPARNAEKEKKEKEKGKRETTGRKNVTVCGLVKYREVRMWEANALTSKTAKSTAVLSNLCESEWLLRE